MYLIEIDSRCGELITARLVPMRMRQFRLERAPDADAEWLWNRLNEIGKPFKTGSKLDNDGSLTLKWSG
jgi:poly-gamma-glutamate synthesis protein (capsule biosynthesis protein)